MSAPRDLPRVHIGCGGVTNTHNYDGDPSEYCPTCDGSHGMDYRMRPQGAPPDPQHGAKWAEAVGSATRPTPYAVSCARHGYQFVTLEFFQEWIGDAAVPCPLCLAAELFGTAAEAVFDDDNFERRST